jgi:hypothetical protein
MFRHGFAAEIASSALYLIATMRNSQHNYVFHRKKVFQNNWLKRFNSKTEANFKRKITNPTAN